VHGFKEMNYLLDDVPEERPVLAVSAKV